MFMMRILICSDGTDPADNPTRLGGLIAGPCPVPDHPTRHRRECEVKKPCGKRWRTKRRCCKKQEVEPQIVLRTGEPIRQILAETTANEYDIAIIGARRKESGGLYWRPEKTYEVIKAVPPPVLVAIGECESVNGSSSALAGTVTSTMRCS